MSENLSSLVNKAYAVLQDPMERAEYLLKLRGIDEQMMEKKMTADIEFLGEVMELNERLEAIDDAESWAAFREENNEKIKILTRYLNFCILTPGSANCTCEFNVRISLFQGS